MRSPTGPCARGSGPPARATYERRFESGAVAHDMAAFFVRARSHGVKRPRRPWRRPHQGLEHRLTALIQDGLGVESADAIVAARRLLGVPGRPSRST